MSDARQETVADIMSGMRKCADRIEQHLLYDLRECATDYLRVLADRIEDAVNRENRTIEKSSEVGNAAKMREALEKVRFYLPHFLQYMRLHREDAEAGGYYESILEIVNAALSASPRNCDAFSKARVLEMLEDRSFSKEDTIEWLFDEAKGEANEQK